MLRSGLTMTCFSVLFCLFVAFGQVSINKFVCLTFAFVSFLLLCLVLCCSLLYDVSVGFRMLHIYKRS